jgi:hypothetical protein
MPISRKARTTSRHAVEEAARNGPFGTHLQDRFSPASTQARYALERRAWNEAVLLVPREPASLDWDRFTWPEAIVRFARGLGAAHLGRVNGARAEVERLNQLDEATRRWEKTCLRGTSECSGSS